jgi:hypothetical protein
MPGIGSGVGAQIITLIGGFEYAANYLFTSQANFTASGDGDAYAVQGALANQFMAGNLTDRIENTITWQDPTDYMINQLRQIAFRTSLQAAKDNLTATNATQTVQYVGSSSETVYKTNFNVVAVAAALNLLAVLAIIPTYRGWWAMGRRFSLSPLEIARAFDAPLLRDTEYNSTWEQITERVGERNVRYGEVDEDNQAVDGSRTVQLLFAEEDNVRRPMARYKGHSP